MIIGFIIWSIVAIVFLAIGFSCRRSHEPAGFFTFVKPPAVKNVEEYNKAVSVLWFIGTAVFEIAGLPFLFQEQKSPYFIFLIVALMIWVIGMMIAYLRIEAKHRK